MHGIPSAPRRHAAAAAIALGLGLSACGNATVSTGSFTGAQHEVAQTISNLQSDVQARDQGKICSNDLASGVVQRLGGIKGCEAAIKKQAPEIENFDVSVKSIAIDATAGTATAQVKSTYGGKQRTVPVSLVKESGRWKVSAVG
jgi:hypothetical protein